MGRELRMVPKDWEHPKDWTGKYKPLHTGYVKDVEAFKEDVKERGLMEAVEYWGGGPIEGNYMPTWGADEATWFMMYEDTTEGTPISPAFETPEELARWLADTNASAFGRQGASYEAWLAMIKRGWALSAVMIPSRGVVSGVEGEYMLDKEVDNEG